MAMKRHFVSLFVQTLYYSRVDKCVAGNVTDYPTDKANRDIVVIIVPLALAACLVVVGVLMCHYISKTRQKSYVPRYKLNYILKIEQYIDIDGTFIVCSWQLEANSQLYMNVEGQGQTPPVDGELSLIHIFKYTNCST
jgi:hypothetical protein